MMTSFGWKKKVGGKVSRTASRAFEEKAKGDADEAVEAGDVDWLTQAPPKRTMMLEDARAKSHRLKEEGATLASAERYWEALRKWDQALQLTPDDEKLMEMKAQAYLTLNEVYPAVQAGERTVEMNPLWWIGHQTLGRARLGLGEVRLAVKCFSRAVHINPAQEELWHDDLFWAADLLRKKQVLEQEAVAAALAEEQQKAAEIIELNEPESHTGMVKTQDTNTAMGDKSMVRYKTLDHRSELDNEDKDCQQPSASHKTTLRHLPENYVVMRN